MDPVLFMLVFIRVVIIVMFIPIFSSPAVPWITKVGFCGFLALIVASSLNADISGLGNGELFMSIITDFLMATAIGLVIRFIFDGIQLAGEYISYQMGFTVINIIDPMSNTQIPIISQLKQLLALLIFFAINGHHYLIRAIASSFEYIPVGSYILSRQFLKEIITVSSRIFLIALKLSSPILVAMFITNVAMGIIARTMPQINIFMLSFPIYIGLGLIIMGIFMPFFIRFIENEINWMILDVSKIIQLMRS
ncbi:MAG: hypothetical protein DRG27_06295 [Deltaproteobacteria bacterium]|nr:MAG: hypothetical protein DRG27_06295 [Deltaproteobacteria bacterium]